MIRSSGVKVIAISFAALILAVPVNAARFCWIGSGVAAGCDSGPLPGIGTIVDGTANGVIAAPPDAVWPAAVTSAEGGSSQWITASQNTINHLTQQNFVLLPNFTFTRSFSLSLGTGIQVVSATFDLWTDDYVSSLSLIGPGFSETYVDNEPNIVGPGYDVHPSHWGVHPVNPLPYTAVTQWAAGLPWGSLTTGTYTLTVNDINTVSSMGIDYLLQFEIEAIPEPATWSMFLAGCLAFGVLTRFRKAH